MQHSEQKVILKFFLIEVKITIRDGNLSSVEELQLVIVLKNLNEQHSYVIPFFNASPGLTVFQVPYYLDMFRILSTAKILGFYY